MISPKKLIPYALLVVGGLSIAAGYYVLSVINKETKGSLPQSPATSTSAVAGKLLLSLVPKTVGEGALPLTYTYDLAQHVLVPTYRTVEEAHQVLPFHTSLSPDRKFLTSLYLQSSFAEGQLDPSTRLMAMPFDGSIFTHIAGELRDSASFGPGKDTVGLAPRLPAVNNKGDMVFGVFPKDVKEKKVSFDWDIRYTNRTADGVIAKGLFPHWISDTHVVYLGRDGIHEYDLTKLTDKLLTKLVGRDGKVVAPAPNMMMNVSRDGKSLVITNPEEMLVTIYQFTEDGTLSKTKHIDAFAFWPVFSPDGKTLALQTLLLADMTNKDSPHPRIVFYDLTKEKPTVMNEVINLDEFVHEVMFFTDWY